MKIIGCDFHTRYQQIAMLDEATVVLTAADLAVVSPSVGVKVAMHGPHHDFWFLGRMEHLQINLWLKGIARSGLAIRIPWPF